MPISGLVVTLSSDARAREAALEALRNHPQIELGDGSPHRHPIVVETANSDETSCFWEWLQALPGVEFVDVAYVHFEEQKVLE